MSRSTVMTILRYSVVIMLLALCMFFWVDVHEPGFVAVCMTMAFCFLVFCSGILRLIADADDPLDKKRAYIALGIYCAVCALAVVLRMVL